MKNAIEVKIDAKSQWTFSYQSTSLSKETVKFYPDAVYLARLGTLKDLFNDRFIGKSLETWQHYGIIKQIVYNDRKFIVWGYCDFRNVSWDPRSAKFEEKIEFTIEEINRLPKEQRRAIKLASINTNEIVRQHAEQLQSTKLF